VNLICSTFLLYRLQLSIPIIRTFSPFLSLLTGRAAPAGGGSESRAAGTDRECAGMLHLLIAFVLCICCVVDMVYAYKMNC
jgi:hypothetical protein